MVDVASEVAADRFYRVPPALLRPWFPGCLGRSDLAREDARAALEYGSSSGPMPLLDADEPDPGSSPAPTTPMAPSWLRWIARALRGDARRRARSASAATSNAAGTPPASASSTSTARGRVHPGPILALGRAGRCTREQPFAEILRHPTARGASQPARPHHGPLCRVLRSARLCRGSHRERALARHSRDAWASDPACVMEDAEIGAPPCRTRATLAERRRLT